MTTIILSLHAVGYICIHNNYCDCSDTLSRMFSMQVIIMLSVLLFPTRVTFKLIVYNQDKANESMLSWLEVENHVASNATLLRASFQEHPHFSLVS